MYEVETLRTRHHSPRERGDWWRHQLKRCAKRLADYTDRVFRAVHQM